MGKRTVILITRKSSEKYSDIHFTNKETKDQKSQLACSNSEPTGLVTEPGFESPQSVTSKLSFFLLQEAFINYKSSDGPGNFKYSEETLLQNWDYSH